MVFWAGILAAALVAWFAVRIGFYEAWIMLFNLVVSTYMSIFLTPVITAVVPAAGDTAYGNALTLIAIALGAFLVLHGLSYSFLTGQFRVSFPQVFDRVGSGLLGFLGGLLIWSFAALVICATPISQNSFLRDFGLRSTVDDTNVAYVAWWCNALNTMVGTNDSKRAAQEVIHKLLKTSEPTSHDDPSRQSAPAGLPEPDGTKAPPRERVSTVQE